ncbi:hypothetical protein Hamer_G005523 [Homarus americanus]|uniref:Endonuclease/exonuclease/phosphatase domain-containing protein n=1 Tax=Homarus americanus TaxID=6706 RepID=A0A8J5K2U0_HOMAM|nr:hypothetical protein Hamer_G005523 [Homarus americanus]
MSKDKQFRLPRYQQYSVPKGPNSHGSMILVRATIPSSEVEPVHCGDGVEAQAVRIHLANDSLVVYNIYKLPPKRIEAGELLTQATQEIVLIAGDFNAHHSTINSTTRMNQDAEDIDQLNQDLTDVIQHAAVEAMPNTNPTNRHHKDYWFYNDEVREQNHRINTFRRHLQQYPSPEGVKLLRAAVQHARPIREDKWLEWCATFNAHTSMSELWRKLRIATGKLPRAPAHPQPLQEANRLAEHFAERSKGPDRMSPDYSTPAPWESPSSVFTFYKLGQERLTVTHMSSDRFDRRHIFEEARNGHVTCNIFGVGSPSMVSVV